MAQINTIFFFEFISQEIDQSVVKVVSTKESISVGGFDFEDSVTNCSPAGTGDATGGEEAGGEEEAPAEGEAEAPTEGGE